MKKYIPLLLALLLLLALPLTACTPKGNVNADTNDNEDKTDHDQTDVNDPTDDDQTNVDSSNEDEEKKDPEQEEEPMPFAPMKVMSYNVQTGTEENVAARAEQVLANILAYSPDVLGTQELNAYWIAEMESRGFLDLYTRVGEPRSEADSSVPSNEYSAIFYISAQSVPLCS